MIDLCMANKHVRSVKILGVMNLSKIHEVFNNELENLCSKKTSLDMFVDYCDILENLDDNLLHDHGIHLSVSGQEYVANYLQECTCLRH